MTEELEERLARYQRLEKNEDYQKTLQEVEDELGLRKGSSFILSSGWPAESVFIQSGGRDVLIALRDLVKNTEAALEQQKKPIEGEIEDE